MTNSMSNTRAMTTHKVVVAAMLCAISFVATLIGQIVPPVAGFLSYDPKDAVIAIAGFIYGPMIAVLISVVESVVEMLTMSSTGIYGCFMNIVSTCAFVVPATLLYKKMHNMQGALIGLLLGMIAMTACMLLWNYIITPFYMGVPRETVAGMLTTVFLPFNLIKSGINTGLTLVLYKPLVTALRKTNLLPKNDDSHGSFHLGFTVFSVLVLAGFILLFLVFTGVL